MRMRTSSSTQLALIAACAIALAGSANAQAPQKPAPAPPAGAPLQIRGAEAPARPAAPAQPDAPAQVTAPAQTAAPAQPARPAADGQVQTPHAEPSQPAPAPEAAPGTGASVPAEAQPAEPPPSTSQSLSEADGRRIAAERARLRAVLAQARARHAARSSAAVAAREPEPRVHGDAGAAIALGVSLDTPWYTDASYDAFDDDDVTTRFGLWAAYDLLSLRSDAIIALEVGWSTEHQDEDDLLGGRLHSELTAHSLHAGAQLRWVPLGWLQPHARLAAGASLLDVQLRTTTQSETFEDGGEGPWGSMVSPFGSLGAGVTLRSPTRSFENRRGQYASLSIGLMLEGGYTLAAPVDVELDGRGPGARDIDLTEAELGELERSGPYARVSAVVRF